VRRKGISLLGHKKHLLVARGTVGALALVSIACSFMGLLFIARPEIVFGEEPNLWVALGGGFILIGALINAFWKR